MRDPNWQTRLSQLIERRRNEPFSWWNFHCLLWAFEGIEAVTGQHYGDNYLRKFKTAKGGLRALRKDGVEKPTDLMRRYLRAPVPIAFVRPGDIVALNAEEADIEIPSDNYVFGPILGICNGRISYFVGEQGLVSYETLRIGQAGYGFHC